MFRSNRTHPANSISLLPHDIELTNPRKQSTQAHARKATLTWLLIHLPFGQNLLDGQPMEVLWSFPMNSLCSQVAVFDLVISLYIYIYIYTYCIESIHFVVTPPSDAEVAPQGCNSVPKRCKPSSSCRFLDAFCDSNVDSKRLDLSLEFTPSLRIRYQIRFWIKVYSLRSSPPRNLQEWKISCKDEYGYVGIITHIWIYIDTLRAP